MPVSDLDLTVPLVSDSKNPSVNFEERWHQLITLVNQLESTVSQLEITIADHEQRIFDLENP